MTADTETRLEYLPALGRRVRLGSWDDQKVSTYRKLREAIEVGRWDDAARLANYFVDEGKVCFSIYRQWIPDLNAFLRESGVAADELELVNAEIVAKLTLPDGTAWNAYEQWDRFLTAIEAQGIKAGKCQAEDVVRLKNSCGAPVSYKFLQKRLEWFEIIEPRTFANVQFQKLEEQAKTMECLRPCGRRHILACSQGLLQKLGLDRR